MLHNNTPGYWFQLSPSQPEEVRLLLFNDRVHLYKAQTEEFLTSFPVKECSIAPTPGNRDLNIISNIASSDTVIVPASGGNNDHTAAGAGWHKIFLTAAQSDYLVLNDANAITRFLLTEIDNKNKPALRRLRTSGTILSLTALLAIVVIFCYFLFTSIIPAMGLRLISTQQETGLGNSLFKSTVNTALIDTQASRIAQEFADHLPLSKQYTIRVYVINNPEINAFAIPGGIIVIHSGILKRMNSYEEFAALLGHEVTHINDRHSLRSMLKSFSFSVFLSIITGDASGVTGTLVSNAAQLESLSYSRQLETSADEKSMEMLEASHIDPEGMLRLMKTLQAQESGKQITFLSSHPLTDRRIEHARSFIKQHDGGHYPVNSFLQQRWQQLKGNGTSF